jgi:ABC-2 type transport system ATP-binding protein
MRRLLTAIVVAAVALVGAVAGGAPADAASGGSTRAFFVTVPDAPGSSSTIRLDAELYVPAATPAPAVLLAHGFGQTKGDLAPEARRLQREGYVVLAYTARGFGASGGEIGLDSLDGEVPDARAMVDVLAKDPAVQHRGTDPVVGVVGGSYGGALALMLGATDPRIDTVVAAITWNDLADALAPRSAGTAPGATTHRDFKVGWASRLFAAGIAGSTNGCGRFTPAFCDLYRRLVTGGAATSADLALLARSSPDTVLSGLRAPTLLLQGVQDRLFGLDQSDRTERALAAQGTPVQLRWFDGGHDGGGIAGTDGVVDAWLAAHLRTTTAVPRTFTFDVPASTTSFGDERTASRYPGLDAGRGTEVRLGGGTQTVVNPPGGLPASVTGIPGLDASSSVGRTAAGLLGAGNPPSEAATFTSAPLTAPVVLAGTARVRIRVSPGGSGTTVLYAQLAARTGDALQALPGGVAPIRIDLPAGGADVTVDLPATAWSFAPGDRVVLTLRTSDTQFVGSTAPASARISIAAPIALPGVAVALTTRTAGLPSTGVLIGIAAALLVALLLVLLALLLGRRAAVRPAPQEDEGPPLEIRGLVKRFRGGFLAVDDVGFTVERGQVLGLLGENGAGKTTTLRMVAGLLRPDDGTVRAFGSPLGPGAPALDRIGCFIEGPGFLAHLSGRRNLELYWAATGRPKRDAHLDEALAVADLGAAIEKRVGGYSQGMRQRLAIAQAMLGLPDLLILDEPTNGLDPPQITALRGVLHRYAAQGRTVVVSSHLLGEVERTCSHVVVMSHGKVVAAGPVEDVSRGGHLEDAFLDLIGATEPSA